MKTQKTFIISLLLILIIISFVSADGVPSSPSSPAGTGSSNKVSNVYYNKLMIPTLSCQIEGVYNDSVGITIKSNDLDKGFFTKYYDNGGVDTNISSKNNKIIAYIGLTTPIGTETIGSDPSNPSKSIKYWFVDSFADGNILLGNYAGAFTGYANTKNYWKDIVIKGSYYGVDQIDKQTILTGTVTIEINQNLSNPNCYIDIQGLEYSIRPSNNTTQNQTNYDSRISALESWKQTIDTWKTGIDSSMQQLLGLNGWIGNFRNTFADIYNKLNPLLNQTSTNSNVTLKNYFKYLSSSDRKTMVCGYGQENNLTSINDLGWNCTITYTTNKYTKKVTSSCKCK